MSLLIVGLDNATFAEKYFHLTISSIDRNATIYSQPIFLTLCHVVSKIATFATDYGDMLCITLSIILASKLESVIRNLQVKLQYNKSNDINVTENENFKQIPWKNVYKDIVKLRKLGDETSAFLSPVFLLSLLVDLHTIVFNVSLNLK